MLEHLVPLVGIEPTWSERRGRSLKLSPVIRKNSQNFCSFVAKGWNQLPKQIRDMTGVSVETFKLHLDRHLSLIEDVPHLPHEGYRRCKNDIVTALTCQKEELRQNLGRAPLSTML